MSISGEHRGWRRWWVGAALLTLLGAALLVPLRPARAQFIERRILIIHSYHQGLSWSDNLLQGFLSVVDPEAQAAEVYVEYLDAKRFALTPADYARFAELYRAKYAGVTFDLIVVADNNAFDFAKQYYAELFSGTPVVFCGINFFEDSMIAGFEDAFTGVVENVDIADTLDAILRLQPNTQRIVVINDVTTTGQIYSQLLRDLIPLYQPGLEFVFYEDPSMPELFAALQAQPSDTAILLVLLNRDREGTFYTYEQSIDLLYANTTLPIYGLWDFYLGRGMMGGKLTNAFSQGAAAGDLSLRILQGTPVRAVPIQRTSPNRYIFDYQQLQRFNISRALLPSDSTLINRPLTFIERYQTMLLISSVGLLLLGGIIVLQRRMLRQRQRIEATLRVTNQQLEDARTNLEVRITERTQALERRTVQLQTASRVARDASAIRNVSTLLATTSELISQRFGFYHAGIFLADEAGDYAILSAASSVGGRRMLARGHRLRSGFGIVGSVLATGKPRIALDVGDDAIWFNNPDLPKTRSELGLPLMVRGQVIGVLDVQSEASNAFTEDDIALLETMTEQLALAIDNARLFEESQRVLAELERLYGSQVQAAWEARLGKTAHAYQYTGVQVEALVVADGQSAEPATERHLEAAVALRDQVLATIELQRSPDQPPWTAEERALVEALSTQAALALENARLIEETLHRAAREQRTREIADDIRAAVSVEDALQRALGQLQRALGAEELVAMLGTPDMSRGREEN